ncbi:MAG: J domain-containing protein [Terracidiphilus sp.]
MITCSCGNNVEGTGTLCNRCTALRILDLEQDATETEIRSSYLTLVKVWHPDRFQNDPKLKEAAEKKLKDINSAYEFLTLTLQERADWQSPKHWTDYAPSTGSSNEEVDAAKRTTSLGNLRRHLSRWALSGFKTFLQIALLALVVLFFRYLWIAFDIPAPTTEEATNAVGTGKEDLLKELEEPKRRFRHAVMRDLSKLIPSLWPPDRTATRQTEHTSPETGSQPDRNAAEKSAVRQPDKVRSAPHKIFSYVTIGSTKDEVIELQGPPTSSSDDKLVYGRSELYLKDGGVIGWKIDPVSDPIRVKLWPEHSVDTSQIYFTLDSTKDDVLVVQGTPTAFTSDEFDYGGSQVYFRSNRVVRWKNDLTSIPLKVKNP